MSDSLANIEALMNIGANLSEIVGIAGGVNCLMWGWMPYAGGLKGASKRIELMGLVLLPMALATPGLVNWTTSVNLVLGMVTTLVLTICIVGGGGYAFMTPYRLADKTKHPRRTLIQTLNCIVIIPFIFPISLAILSFTDKDKRLALGGPAVLGCQLNHDGSAET
jgi:hypothetical protein